MKPLLFAGLALALSAPAWAQPQPQDGPPAPPDGPMAPDDGRFDDRGPGADDSVQQPIPRRRGGGGNSMMGGGPMRGTLRRGPVAAPPVSMFADERYLFVLRGDTLMQFDKKSLTLLKSVELPSPVTNAAGAAVTPDVDPDGQLRSRTSPPLMRRPIGGGIGF